MNPDAIQSIQKGTFDYQTIDPCYSKYKLE